MILTCIIILAAGIPATYLFLNWATRGPQYPNRVEIATIAFVLAACAAVVLVVTALPGLPGR
jgi:hypothetical protein